MLDRTEEADRIEAAVAMAEGTIKGTNEFC